MTPEEIRTLTLFNTVENRPEINQRQLAQELDVSLGLANTYFKRVLKKGWVRAKHVKARRWLYFLTPKGAVEKSKLSLSYLNRTLESFRELKVKGDKFIHSLSEKQIKGVHLCGETDLTEILSFCFTGLDIKLLSTIPEDSLLKKISKKNKKIFEIKKNEIIVIASLGKQKNITNMLIKNGLRKNLHWVLFS